MCSSDLKPLEAMAQGKLVAASDVGGHRELIEDGVTGTLFAADNPAAIAAALGGLDAIVFTGGIGENAPRIRKRICDGLGFLGIALDPARNAQNAPLISRDGERVRVRVVPTNEQLMIARSVSRVLNLSAKRKA